jgi:hypothetical protein
VRLSRSALSRRHLFGNVPGDFDCITQLDFCEWVSKTRNISRCIWPQHDMLSELVSRYPAAKYVYTTRNTTTWFDSLSRWGDFLDRIRFSNTPGLECGASDADVKKWYDTKHKAVQRFFQQTGEENRLFMLPVENTQSMAPDLLDFLFKGNINKANVTREYPRENKGPAALTLTDRPAWVDQTDLSPTVEKEGIKEKHESTGGVIREHSLMRMFGGLTLFVQFALAVRHAVGGIHLLGIGLLSER